MHPPSGRGWISVGIGAFLCLMSLLAMLTNKTLGPQAAGKRLARQQRTLYSGTHDYRDATDADLAQLDVAFYERTTADLTSQRFRKLRDVVNVTASSTWPSNLAVMRVFVDDAGTTMAAVYHLRIFGSAKALQAIGVLSKKLKMVEFESELSDGTGVATTNAAEAERTSGYPFVDRIQFPNATPPLEVLAAHRQHLRDVLASKSGVAVIPIRTYDELRKSQDRLQSKKSAYRRPPQFDRYAADFESIRGRPLNADELTVVDEVDKDLRPNQNG